VALHLCGRDEDDATSFKRRMQTVQALLAECVVPKAVHEPWERLVLELGAFVPPVRPGTPAAAAARRAGTPGRWGSSR
jgi:hypothetical protein